MKKGLTFFLFLFSISYIHSQVPYIVWQRAMGGNFNEMGNSIIRTSDNSIAIVGYTESNVQYPDIPNQHAVVLEAPDFWFLKLANDGSVLYSHCYGGGFHEQGFGITETRGGRIVLLGSADSNDQYVQGVHGAWSQVGLTDYWLIQLDSSYNVEWQHCYGTTEIDNGFSIKTTNGNGFILCGEINGFDGDVTNFHGSSDIWVVKTDSLGNIIWQTALGGYSYDNSSDLLATEDGGFIVGCTRAFASGNITCTDINKEIWVVKLDSLGNILWDKCYGGSGSDQLKKFLPASNNGFYAVGWTNSSDGDISTPPAGSYDGWVFKADESGNILWDKCYGGSFREQLTSASFTSDGNIVCSGGTDSPEFSPQGGAFDMYVVKIDTLGNVIWQTCYGGTGEDYANSITEASDSSLFLVGYSTSDDGDLTINRGQKDMWIVKLSSPTQTGINAVQNSVINLLAHLNDGVLAINFYANKVEDMKICLYDVSGRRIKTINQRTQIGENQLQAICNPVHGVYILQLEFKNGLLSKKLVY